MSAVSLLGSGEQRYINAINNNNVLEYRSTLEEERRRRRRVTRVYCGADEYAGGAEVVWWYTTDW